jgi:hypothetical protein
MSYTSGRAFEFPAVVPLNNENVSTSPFHDCMAAGGDFNDCRIAAQVQRQSQELKRSTLPSSTSPFHDCMEAGNATWTDCTTTTGLTARLGGSNSEHVADQKLEV